MNVTGTLKSRVREDHEKPFGDPTSSKDLLQPDTAARDVGNMLPALHYSSNSEIFMKKLLLIMIVPPWGDVAEVYVHWPVRVVVQGSLSSCLVEKGWVRGFLEGREEFLDSHWEDRFFCRTQGAWTVLKLKQALCCCSPPGSWCDFKIPKVTL